jgi:hypothetical protein
MKKKNQLADLRRLIALPPNQVRRFISEYLYEKPPTLTKMLFKLLHTEKLTRQKRENIVNLTKFVLDQYSPRPIPEWLLNELKRLLITDRLSKVDKAIIFSAFNPEELLEKLDGFDEFVNEFTEVRESFSEYIIEQLSENPSILNEIFQIIIEKSNSESLFQMMLDLSGAHEPQILKFLELFTYHPDESVAYQALKAIESSESQEAVKRLYSISRLNRRFREEAEDAYIYLMHQLPMPSEEEITLERDESEEYLDIWVSLIDGNGAMSTFIGRRFGRNKYFASSVLMKTDAGVKEVLLMSNMPREGYRELKEAYFSDLSFYPIDERYLKRLIKHFLKIGEKAGSTVPVELIILKNILNWDDLEPTEYIYEVAEARPIKYYPRDMFQFPFETWWMHEEVVYDILRPYRDKKVYELPDRVFYRIVDLFIDYARREIVPKCELCADIIRNSKYNKRTRQTALYLTIRNEILNTNITNYYTSHFLSYGIVATIENTLHNLSLGIESPRDIE